VSLLRSIHTIWKNSASLCDATTGVPHERVFTGRIPQTKQYAFPYVSILVVGGGQTGRTDKTRYSRALMSFHIWVDDDDLEFAHELATVISDEYADNCWQIDSTSKVLDITDEGEPNAHQTTLPTTKAWEVVKLFTVFIERQRADQDNQCCVDAFDTSLGSTSL